MGVITILLNKENIILRIRDNATNDEIKKELKEKLPDLKNFYQEEKTPILVTGKILKINEIDEIEKIIQKVIDVKVDFDSPRSLGLYGIKRCFRKEILNSETKFYKGSVRSGQKLEFEGSIVIIGDINDGAEVVAEDNIIVTENIRGIAHAGAKGNQNAIIAAHMIDAKQVRIASSIKERSKDEIETQVSKIAFVNEKGEIEFSF